MVPPIADFESRSASMGHGPASWNSPEQMAVNGIRLVHLEMFGHQ